MSTGTTADFQVTRNDLIEMALGMIGVTEPSNAETALSVKVLNSLVRHVDAKASWLWAIDSTESTVTLVGGQDEYTTGTGANNIATNILALEECSVLQGNDRLPLTMFGSKEAITTPLRSDTNAQPVAVFLQKAALRENNVMTFYPTPNAAYTITYHYRRPLFDFDKATDNPDFPQDWFLPLQKMLASELASYFGIPLQERQLLMAEAEKAYRESAAFNASKPSYTTLETEYF